MQQLSVQRLWSGYVPSKCHRAAPAIKDPPFALLSMLPWHGPLFQMVLQKPYTNPTFFPVQLRLVQMWRENDPFYTLATSLLSALDWDGFWTSLDRTVEILVRGTASCSGRSHREATSLKLSSMHTLSCQSWITANGQISPEAQRPLTARVRHRKPYSAHKKQTKQNYK